MENFKEVLRVVKDFLHGEDLRCYRCAEQDTCPTPFGGVLYPCPRFKQMHKNDDFQSKSITKKEKERNYYGNHSRKEWQKV